jgi:uncharacterized protein
MNADRDTPGLYVYVVFATAGSQTEKSLPWSQGLTAGTAVQRSGLEPAAFDEQGEPVIGLFGRRISLQHPLTPGDRIEICRPLVADPRAARRVLAARGMVMGAGGEVVPQAGSRESDSFTQRKR